MKKMKILWAVNIFENHPLAINAVTTFFQAMSKNIEIKVDAATVVFPLNIAIESKEASIIKTENLKKLNSVLAETRKFGWFGKSMVLLETQIPQRVAVLNLTEYAKSFDYDAILVVKHSGNSHSPHYLGSFAEMTAFLSTLPIFLINPDGFIPEQIRKIFIAQDETAGKEKEFKELVNFFPVQELKLTLFHQISIPFYYLSKESIKQFVVDQKRIIRSNMQSIKRIAENGGANIEFSIKSKSNKIEDSILQEAMKESAELIATFHKRKGVSGLFLGRVTRRLLQKADRPILLFRP